jgi:protein SCO1/2
MCKRSIIGSLLCLAFLATACKNSNDKPEKQAPAVEQSAPVSGTGQNSIYQADMTFKNQWNKDVSWSSLQGKVQVMAMVFTHCAFACPRITQDIRQIEKLIPPKDTSKVRYTLISFDVKRDVPSRLAEYFKEQALDSRWQLLHGSEDDVETVSALLDVKYKPGANGLFSHQNIITVVSPKGIISARQEGLSQSPDSLVKVITGLANELQ